MRIPALPCQFAALSLVYVSVSADSKPYMKEFHNELTIPDDPFQVSSSPNEQSPKERKRGLFPKRETEDDKMKEAFIEENEEIDTEWIEQVDQGPQPPPPPPVDTKDKPFLVEPSAPQQQAQPKPPPPPRPLKKGTKSPEDKLPARRPAGPVLKEGGRDAFLKFERHDGSLQLETSLDRRNRSESNSVSVSIDPVSGVRLAQAGIQGSAAFGTALYGTLRLLAPLIVARRGLASMIDIMSDWYTGRYFRTTVKRMEHQYWRYYQVPAALRSAGRLASQTLLLFTLGRIMEWMIGLDSPPCHLTGFGGCHWYCAILWIISVIVTGHAGGAAIAVWGGPLRIQIASMNNVERPSARRVFTRPWRIMQFMRDPDTWLRDVAMQRKNGEATLKPFHPDPLLFPTTWEPLRILQMIAVAKEMAGSDRIMYLLMRQVLAQQAIGDEWYRALMCEKRVALGIALISCYLIATLRLFWTAATSSSLSALLVLPSLLAVMISAWMNIFIYFDRREAKRQQAIAETRGRIGNQRQKLLL